MSMKKRVIHCPVVGCDALATDRHHIGGHGSPTIWLCKNCHGRLHGVSWNSDHSELTKQGLVRAKAAGRLPGNPGLRARDPEAIRTTRVARDAAYLKQLIEVAPEWLRVASSMPEATWQERADVIGVTSERLRRGVKRMVVEGRADAKLLERAPHRRAPLPPRLAALAKVLSENRSLRQIAGKLEELGERTPRGKKQWAASSVRGLLLRAGSRMS